MSLAVYRVERNEALKTVTNLGEKRNVFLQSKRVFIQNSEENINDFIRTLDVSSGIITKAALSHGELTLR